MEAAYELVNIAKLINFDHDKNQCWLDFTKYVSV